MPVGGGAPAPRPQPSDRPAEEPEDSIYDSGQAEVPDRDDSAETVADSGDEPGGGSTEGAVTGGDEAATEPDEAANSDSVTTTGEVVGGRSPGDDSAQVPIGGTASPGRLPGPSTPGEMPPEPRSVEGPVRLGVEGCVDRNVVAKQLCEIASQEQDPLLREALWAEYVQYLRLIGRPAPPR